MCHRCRGGCAYIDNSPRGLIAKLSTVSLQPIFSPGAVDGVNAIGKVLILCILYFSSQVSPAPPP